MRNLNDLKREIEKKGFENSDYGVASKKRFNNLEWIQVTKIEPVDSKIDRYFCNSNIGAICIYLGGRGIGISPQFSSNSEFKLKSLANSDMPRHLSELAAEYEGKGEMLLFRDARDYVRRLKLKSEQEYYDWWDKHQPKFLPRNPDIYYSNSGPENNLS